MSTITVEKSSSSVKQGITAGSSIALGYMPIAIAFGLLARETGLTTLETVMMSVFVFAGASQYISLSLIAVGVGTIEIIITTFVVNIRHILMGSSLAEKVEEDQPWKKAIYAFGITDETFSVASLQSGKLSSSFLYGLNFTAYVSWVLFSGIGHVLGEILPAVLQESMSIALYSMFIGLLVPSMKKSWKITSLAGLAGAFHAILALGFHLSTGWAIMISTLLSAVIVELFLNTVLKGGEKHE